MTTYKCQYSGCDRQATHFFGLEDSNKQPLPQITTTCLEHYIEVAERFESKMRLEEPRFVGDATAGNLAYLTEDDIKELVFISL